MAKLIGNARYCFHQRPNQVKNDRKFQVDIELSEDEQKKAEELGLKVKPADDVHPDPFIKIQSKVTSDDHLEFTPDGRKPKAFDSRGNVYNGPIGHGSKVAVNFDVWESPNGPKAIWRSIQVINLILPEGWDENSGSRPIEDDIEVYEGGFVVGDTIGNPNLDTNIDDI